MTTWIEDLAQHLEDSTTSIGVFSPTSTETRTIFCNNLPGSTASLVVLYPYAGLAPEYQQDLGNYRKPRLNVAVYSTDADGGHQKGIDIRTRLDRITDLSLPSSTTSVRHYVVIEALGEPEYLGTDEHKRGMFSINFQVEYSNITT
jgi:hypothetical protein